MLMEDSSQQNSVFYTEILTQSKSINAISKMPCVGLAVAEAFSVSCIIMTALIMGPGPSLTGPAEGGPGSLPGPSG